MLKQFLAGYFNFTRKERWGIFSVFLLIIFFLTLPFLFPLLITKKQNDHREFEKEIAALDIKQHDSTSRAYGFDENNYQNFYQPSEQKYYEKQHQGELFYFDPNTLPADGWKKLGIRDKTVNTIQNYLSKGGKFYKPEDIGKIWGLHKDQIERLIPYVRIEQKNNNQYTTFEKKDFYTKSEKSNNTRAFIDINTADTSDLIALPGIGSKLANRIISFREKLGGFYNVNQVAETYALPDSTFQKIKDRLMINNPSVKKLNINTATVDELKLHPYIRYNIANAIVQYRNQHGDFAVIGDLKKIMLVTDEIYSKAEPYLIAR